jgi:hypothetical protein
MIATTTAIVPVLNHPNAHSARGSTKRPITSWRIAISMMITIQWHGNHAVYYRRPKQRFDWVEANEVDADTNESGHRDVT